MFTDMPAVINGTAMSRSGPRRKVSGQRQLGTVFHTNKGAVSDVALKHDRLHP